MIYLIKNRNYLKIGYSNNIEERLKNYNIHNPNYELLAIRTEQESLKLSYIIDLKTYK